MVNNFAPVPIENKEIRGISAKHFVWLFGFLTTILISVVGTYYSITNKIDNMQENVRTMGISKDIQDAQIKALNLQMQALEMRIVKLETQSELYQFKR